MINLAFVKKCAGQYPLDYDETYYYPYLKGAKAGDEDALLKLMEWKNGSRCGPRPLMRNQKKAFDKFLLRKTVYLGADGGEQLKIDFSNSAPVYSIFWHHVRFDTPIFDVHTNRAFQWYGKNEYKPRREPAVRSGKHWQLYDEYVPWFNDRLEKLRLEDEKFDPRDLDRALFQWGKHHKDKKPI